MYPPRRIPPSELRPSRGWYVFAAIFAVIMFVGGGVGLAYGIVTAVKTIDLGTKFNSGQTISVTWDTTPTRAIFARASDPGRTHLDCSVTGPDGNPLQLTVPGGKFTTTINGVSWMEIYTLNPPTAGTYRVTCRSSDVPEFAAGKHPRVSVLLGGVLGGIAAVAIGGVGILISIIITIVVAVRRGNHRRRLQYPY
jgi:hypothetical protein